MHLQAAQADPFACGAQVRHGVACRCGAVLRVGQGQLRHDLAAPCDGNDFTTLHALDQGQLRVAERQTDGKWHVNQWAKKAVLLGFRLKDMEMQSGGPQGGGWWDKVDTKFAHVSEDAMRATGIRVVFGRSGAWIMSARLK